MVWEHARPEALDIAERLLNGPDRKLWREIFAEVCFTRDWQPINKAIGVPEAEIECFASDLWGDDERHAFMNGFLVALGVAQTDRTIRIVHRIEAGAPHVDYEVAGDSITVILCANAAVPAK